MTVSRETFSEAGLGRSEPLEHFALLVPVDGECFQEIAKLEFGIVPAIEDRLDDIGRQQGEADDATDVAGVDLLILARSRIEAWALDSRAWRQCSARPRAFSSVPSAAGALGRDERRSLGSSTSGTPPPGRSMIFRCRRR